MRKFIVKVIIRVTETWEVLACDETEARALFEEGILLRSDGYELEGVDSVDPVDIAPVPL